MQKEIAALDPRTVYSYSDFREFSFYLERLVARECGRVICKNLLESAALALVTSGQYGNVFVLPFFACEQCAEYHFRMRCLSCSSCCNVPHADGGSLAGMHLEHPMVVQGVPYFQGQIIWC